MKRLAMFMVLLASAAAAAPTKYIMAADTVLIWGGRTAIGRSTIRNWRPDSTAVAGVHETSIDIGSRGSISEDSSASLQFSRNITYQRSGGTAIPTRTALGPTAQLFLSDAVASLRMAKSDTAKSSATGSMVSMTVSLSGTPMAAFSDAHTASVIGPNMLNVTMTAAPNDTSHYFMRMSDGSIRRAIIRSDGSYKGLGVSEFGQAVVVGSPLDTNATTAANYVAFTGNDSSAGLISLPLTGLRSLATSQFKVSSNLTPGSKRRRAGGVATISLHGGSGTVNSEAMRFSVAGYDTAGSAATYKSYSYVDTLGRWSFGPVVSNFDTDTSFRIGVAGASLFQGNLQNNQNGSYDIGNAVAAWDTVFANAYTVVADIPFLDGVDDVASIRAIRGSGVTDDNGQEIVDDNTMPREIMVTYQEDRVDTVDAPDGHRMPVQRRKGDLVIGGGGKPFMSMGAAIGQLQGAIRQTASREDSLEMRIEWLEEQVKQINAKLSQVQLGSQ